MLHFIYNIYCFYHILIFIRDEIFFHVVLANEQKIITLIKRAGPNILTKIKKIFEIVNKKWQMTDKITRVQNFKRNRKDTFQGSVFLK